METAIPGGLSMLAFLDPNAEVEGLKAFPKEERPPVLITFIAFRGMVGLGFLFVLLSLICFKQRNKLTESPILLLVMLFAIPLPYIAAELGWIVTEVGRQPWVVYGMMKTVDAASPIPASHVITSLIAFVVLYSLLALVDLFLIVKYAKRGLEA